MRAFQSIGDRREARIERGAKTIEQLGQRILEIAVLALAEAVPRHVDMAAKMLLLRIERGDLPAFLRRQQLLEHRAAIAAELARERIPVVSRRRVPRASRMGAAATILARAVMPAPPSRASRACARRPSGSRTARRRSSPPGGTGSPPRSCWRHRPAPRPAPSLARRCGPRSRHSSRSCRPGSRRSACQTRCWNAVPRTSSGRSRPDAAPPRSPRPWRPVARSRRRRRSGWPAGTDCEIAHQRLADRRRERWRRRPSRCGRPGSEPSEHSPMREPDVGIRAAGSEG